MKVRILIGMKQTVKLISCLMLILASSSFSFALKSDTNQRYLVESFASNHTGSPVIIGFHPSEVKLKDLEVWKDSLRDLAETFNAILFCPSGGRDGRNDSEHDFQFINSIVDSLFQSGYLDKSRVLCVGLNSGADDALAYTVSENSRSTGVFLVNPKESGLRFIYPNLSNLDGKNVLLFHHYKNFPSTRYYPLVRDFPKFGVNLKHQLVKAQGVPFYFTTEHRRFQSDVNWFFTTRGLINGKVEMDFYREKVLINEVPAEGSISIQIESGKPGVLIAQLFSHTGELHFKHVHQIKAGKQYLLLPVDKAPAGIYRLQLKGPKGINNKNIRIL